VATVKELLDRTTFIYFLRFSAAGIVALAHLRDVMFADYKALLVHPLWFTGVAALTGFAGDAVMIFFVMSGWLVGGGLLNARNSAKPYSEYTIARITRLWTVLLPLFAIQAVSHFPEFFRFSGAYGAGTLLGNLTGFQTVYFDTYAGNFPLWSLANETAYYAAFAGLIAAFDARFSAFTRAACLITVISYGAVLTGSIRVYFVVWLIGALATRLRFTVSNRNFYIYLLTFLAIIIFKRANNLVNNITYDIASSIPLALLLSNLPEVNGAKWKPIFARLAEFSFSLYVVHMPIIWLFNFNNSDLTDLSIRHLAEFCWNFALLLTFAFIYAQLFEARYSTVRQWVRGRVISRDVKQSSGRNLTLGSRDMERR
jgi:peptidoglycan/LPS O-acetylase OafA/YrhL